MVDESVLKKVCAQDVDGVAGDRSMAAVSAISPAEKRYAILPLESILSWLIISKTIGVRIKTALSLANRMLTVAASRKRKSIVVFRCLSKAAQPEVPPT